MTDSIEEFYRAEYVGLVRIVTGLIGDHHAAQDLVHDVFLRLQPRWGTLTGPPLPYARQAALNAGRNEIRRRRRAERPTPAAADEPSAESDALDQIAAGSVREAVLTLPDRQREVIVLRHLAGLSVAETAAMLGIRQAAVKSAGHRAMTSLHALLEEEHHGR